jgi:hypothetical protein
MISHPSSESAKKLYRDKMKLANFVICQTCFWCASCFKAYEDFPGCKICTNPKETVDSLPIFEKEFFRKGENKKQSYDSFAHFGRNALQTC